MTPQERFQQIEQVAAAIAEESRAQDKRLGERIDALVSAIGQYLSRPRN